MDILTEALKKAVSKLSDTATKQLRAHAVQDGWEPHIADSLSVNVDSSSAVVTVDDQFADKAFDHEFGTQNHTAKATIRKSGVQDTFKANLAILLDQELGKMK